MDEEYTIVAVDSLKKNLQKAYYHTQNEWRNKKLGIENDGIDSSLTIGDVEILLAVLKGKYQIIGGVRGAVCHGGSQNNLLFEHWFKGVKYRDYFPQHSSKENYAEISGLFMKENDARLSPYLSLLVEALSNNNTVPEIRYIYAYIRKPMIPIYQYIGESLHYTMETVPLGEAFNSKSSTVASDVSLIAFTVSK
ncbi:MAG: hypothetical protein OCD01_13810 [Fibrobacterales bacterium]